MRIALPSREGSCIAPVELPFKQPYCPTINHLQPALSSSPEGRNVFSRCTETCLYLACPFQPLQAHLKHKLQPKSPSFRETEISEDQDKLHLGYTLHSDTQVMLNLTDTRVPKL